MAAKTGGSHTYGGGAEPVTFTVFVGVTVSFVDTVMSPVFEPGDVGWNRIGTSTLSPGATFIGKRSTCGASNSEGADEAMPLMSSGHDPLLLIVRSRSLNAVVF